LEEASKIIACCNVLAGSERALLMLLLGCITLIAQQPIIVKLTCERSVGRSVGWSVCPVHCEKTADQIWMPFGIIGRTGPRMRQVVRFGDRSTGSGTFGGEFGMRHCNQWGLYGYVCDSVVTWPSSQITLGRLVIIYTETKAPLYLCTGWRFGLDQRS